MSEGILTLKLIFQIMQQKLIKNVTDVDTSTFALKKNLARLKTEVDKLGIDKLVPAPADLSKLSDVIKNEVVKKTVHGKLAAKVDNIDASEFILITKYQTDKTELEKKIPDVTDFVKKTKLTELENKIPDVSSLATKTALTAVENKIPDVSSLVKKHFMTQKPFQPMYRYFKCIASVGRMIIFITGNLKDCLMKELLLLKHLNIELLHNEAIIVLK